MVIAFWEEYETDMALGEWHPEMHRENTWWAMYAPGSWALWLRKLSRELRVAGYDA